MPRSEAVVAQEDDAIGALPERRQPKSRALLMIAGYFNVTAVLSGVSWLALLAFAYAGPTRFAPLLPLLPWRTVGMIASVAMQLRIGQLLHRRSREGGIWAIAALAPGVLTRLMHQSTPLSNYGLIIPLVGLGLVALVWKELE
ncbi:MAG: hypothetical protein ACYC3L_13570 [Gemmatimonadaceae bacterium]